MKKYLFSIFILSFVINLTAMSEQYVVRTEYSFCKFKEGKTYEDVVAFNKQYEAFLKENNLQYSRYLFTPVLAGEVDFDYVTWGTWPNGEEMYKEYGAFLNDYKGSGENPGKCSGTYSVINNAALHIRIPSEEYDRIQFADFRSCKLTKNGDFQELLKISAEREKLMREAGVEGYGIHYLRPYRGFDNDYEYDFITMIHWYNRETRADATKNWRANNAILEKNGIWKKYQKHVESCGNAKTYAMEWLYNTAS